MARLELAPGQKVVFRSDAGVVEHGTVERVEKEKTGFLKSRRIFFVRVPSGEQRITETDATNRLRPMISEVIATRSLDALRLRTEGKAETWSAQVEQARAGIGHGVQLTALRTLYGLAWIESDEQLQATLAMEKLVLAEIAEALQIPFDELVAEMRKAYPAVSFMQERANADDEDEEAPSS